MSRSDEWDKKEKERLFNHMMKCKEIQRSMESHQRGCEDFKQELLAENNSWFFRWFMKNEIKENLVKIKELEFMIEEDIKNCKFLQEVIDDDNKLLGDRSF